ncbi:NMD protein affecting ribosome stability and mRNA decay [Acidianus sulfidivorans JP7]|uniref:NMD protein affecting ribosome stability and mRNA decay n=1 Tax=Acidianus sulfidivorans JP7 TaxID=619593 RepID=A0A2U9IKV0_9CREN|nr:60S ribosomal export protein NMD3 [Acidianus sulfidivorans]AWR96659.1 NMD protein affecting ribosome stability and mRNA decay [Acidianus sulfidivorans JP7]
MVKKFCVRCGKEDVELIDRLCYDCYLQTKNLIEIPTVITGEICKICNSEKIDRKWVRLYDNSTDAINDIILRFLGKKAKIDSNVKDYRIDLGDKWKDRNGRTFVNIIFQGRVGDKKFQITRTVELRISQEICDSCSKKRGKYYEAIIQLRGRGKLEEEKRALFESFFSNDIIDSLSDVVEGKEGVDYYFINKYAAKKLISNFKSLVKAEITESFENERIKDGKREAKLVISIRL